MTKKTLLSINDCEIQPRAYKSSQQQSERTKKKAEVFTPSWICNQMNNHCDEEWFGRKNVFNKECNKEWIINNENIEFNNKSWKEYVNSTRLEITCGEAPYIVSRYDTSTGELIPIKKRIGILDRKLRVINENTKTIYIPSIDTNKTSINVLIKDKMSIPNIVITSSPYKTLQFSIPNFKKIVKFNLNASIPSISGISSSRFKILPLRIVTVWSSCGITGNEPYSSLISYVFSLQTPHCPIFLSGQYLVNIKGARPQTAIARAGYPSFLA